MKNLSNIAIGALGGLAGAFAMSVVILTGQQLGMVRDPKPHQLERNLERKLGVEDETSPTQKVALAQGLHHLIGIGYGVLYGLVRPLVSLPEMIFGLIFGAGSYVLDEMVMGPALGLTPHPKHEPEPRVVRRVFLHLLFGVVISMVWQQLNARFAES